MNKQRGTFFIYAIVISSILISGCHATAPSIDERRGFKSKTRMTRAEQIAQELIHTGLKPAYPSDATCPEVSSFFGDRTRYDGSLRTLRSNNGYHGGMDISLPAGTPLVAIADGTVIQTARGGRLVGIKIALQHSPEDTGLPVWIYSKYQHLDEFPGLKVGDRVKMGDMIGLSGRTGTVGSHYGSSGYPHLHLNIYMSKSKNYQINESDQILRLENRKYLDPLSVYYGKELDSHAIKALPEKEKILSIPFMTTDGLVTPLQTKFIWPVLCNPQ
ncbi:MAG TPA: M23 family metallopeptidase [Deltaproteobacteria bacterium]|nr:M23 family metallopeptidase [Deltaproteobacteria bacterium]